MIYILAEDDDLPYTLPCNYKVINVSGQTYFPPNSPNFRNYFTYMAMMRACLSEILKVDKVISLDVDTIICDSLRPLWNIDLTEKWIAWCREWTGKYHPFGDLYFNFGVTVMNLKQMRKDKATELFVTELNRVRYWCSEQDVINKFAVPQGKYKEIPPRYNECFCCGYTDNPAVVHYAGHTDWYTDQNMYRREYLDKYLNLI